MPERIGQATAIEQSRAVAEVHAAILVAQKAPRSITLAQQMMRESTAQKYLADRAFFRFSRGGSRVSGATVYLARELARCWGNVQYGVAELRRDDEHGQSEMLAFAWDVQTNTRVETKFIVPHMRDKKTGPERITDMRDIYENNANNGARRVRECIYAILPPWFVEDAKNRCMSTLERGEDENGNAVPLAKRVADAIELFANIGVSVAQLERNRGRASAAWTAHDVGQLGVIYRGIQREEVKLADEFEPDRITAADVIEHDQAADATGGDA